MNDQYLDSLQSSVLDLIRDLKDNVFEGQDEQGELMLVEFFFKRQNPNNTMNSMVQKVLPHKAQIQNRDLHFFLENRTLFSGLPEDRVSYYSNMIANGKLDDEDVEVIWEYFDTFIALCEQYQKVK